MNTINGTRDHRMQSGEATTCIFQIIVQPNRVFFAALNAELTVTIVFTMQPVLSVLHVSEHYSRLHTC